MSTQTCYTRTQTKETIPINIIPSNLIKCTHCNVYVPYNQLQAHTQQHIPVSLQSAYTLQGKANKYETIKKVDLKGVIMDEDSGDICVRSLLPDEMPAVQSVRSNIRNIQNSKQNNPKISTPITNYKTNYRNLDSMTSHQAPTPQPYIQFPETQQIQKLSFQKAIRLRQQHQQLKKVQIKYYKSQQPLQNGWYINQVSIPSKTQQLEEYDKENDYYIVNSIKPKNSEDVKNVPMRVHLRSSIKEPIFRQKISTVSTGQGFFTARTNKQEYDHTDQTTSNKQVNKNECEECHGFYCKTCGSDIPPIYRPVTNNSNRKSNQESAYLSPSTKSFYNSQVYNRSPVGKTSRLTGCSNCE